MYNTNNGMYTGYEVETNKETYKEKTNMNTSYNSQNGLCNNSMPGLVMPPVYECPQERIIHREIMHEVPHVCPINTRIVNHHIYRHTYSPCYTCCEENEICNINEGCCNNF